MPWKTIDILSDWAANSKSQLNLLKPGFKLTYFKNRKEKKKTKKRERARKILEFLQLPRPESLRLQIQ